MKLKAKLLLMTIVPLIGLLAFSVQLALTKHAASGLYADAARSGVLIGNLGDLMHEVQKERGMSAGFLGSKGKNFSTKLPVQRKKVDAQKEQLTRFLNTFDAPAYGTDVVKGIAKINSLLSEIPKTRRDVNGLAMSVKNEVAFYTNINNSLFDLISVFIHLNFDPDKAVISDLALMQVSYYAVLQIKERAGIERAILSNVFAKDKFSKGTLTKVISLIKQQTAYEQMFFAIAEPQQRDALRSVLEASVTADVQKYRDIALANADTGNFGVDSVVWFATISKKINALNDAIILMKDDYISETSVLSNSEQQIMMASLVLVFLIFAMFVAFTLMSRTISSLLVSMTESMDSLSQGNLDVEICGQGRADEIGLMAESMNVFKENAIHVKKMESEKAGIAEKIEEDKRQLMVDMADDFEISIGGVVEKVSSAATEMQASAQSLSNTAEEATQQSKLVSTGADNATQNVQTVAAATEELSSSIQEISRQVTQSTKIAGEAVVEVNATNEKIQGLAEAANKIGEVVAMITDIADQTNLLALNATIEAARAGDAGKGFAVVASEVKNLANQTARATEEISTQISNVQGATQEAVEAIGNIGGTITHINEITSSISAAVEEQGAATQEIARNVEQAANGTTEVSSNIAGVTQAATETGSSATQMLEASGELSQQAETLRSQVDQFLCQIRTG